MLDIDLNLPDHTEELTKAKERTEELKKQINIIGSRPNIPQKDFLDLHNKLIGVLYYVGDLSMSVFDEEENVQDQYLKALNKQPELARSEWQKHYHELHQPYNAIKNRLFKLLDQLDDSYIKKNKTFPPEYC